MPVEFPIDVLRERSLRYVFPDISTLEHLEHTVRLVSTGRVRLKPAITHVLHGIDNVPKAFEITANKGKYRGHQSRSGQYDAIDKTAVSLKSVSAQPLSRMR